MEIKYNSVVSYNLANCFTFHMEITQGSILFVRGLCLVVTRTRALENIFEFDSHSHNNAARHDANGFVI